MISENQYHRELLLARELLVKLDLEKTFHLALQCIYLLRWESYFLVNKDILIFYKESLISSMHSKRSCLIYR